MRKANRTFNVADSIGEYGGGRGGRGRGGGELTITLCKETGFGVWNYSTGQGGFFIFIPLTWIEN